MADDIKTDDDAFSAAFADLMKMEDSKPPTSPVGTETPPPPETPPSEIPPPVAETPVPPVAETPPPPVAETPPPPVAETPVPPVAEVPPPAEAAKQDDDLLARLVAMARKPEPEPPKAAAPKEPAPELFSVEEKEALSTYEKDYPDIARAESLRRKAEYQALVGYVFAEVAKELRPMVEAVRSMSDRTQYADLKAGVEDYDDTLVDKVTAWTDTQPAYLQAAYKRVITEGTANEVIDLIGRYKQETGVTPKMAPPAPGKKESELPTATKQAAASLAPVSSKRSAAVTTSTPADFDGAFELFAEKLRA